MSGKSKINVFNKMTKIALDEEISNCVAYHRYYQRLIAVKIVSEGNTITNAANILGKSYQTVHKWIKRGRLGRWRRRRRGVSCRG